MHVNARISSPLLYAYLKTFTALVSIFFFYKDTPCTPKLHVAGPTRWLCGRSDIVYISIYIFKPTVVVSFARSSSPPVCVFSVILCMCVFVCCCCWVDAFAELPRASDGCWRVGLFAFELYKYATSLSVHPTNPVTRRPPSLVVWQNVEGAGKRCVCIVNSSK